MTRVTKFDNRDAATVLHLLAKYDYVARLPRYPAFAWRVLSSRFRRLAAAHGTVNGTGGGDSRTRFGIAAAALGGGVLGAIAADCWWRAELAEWRDSRRRRWTWGAAPLAVTAIAVTPPRVQSTDALCN